MASKKIKSFCISIDENYLFAANLSGELLTIATNNLAILNRQQVQPGGIIAVCAHKSLPYLATLGMDRSVVLFKIGTNGDLSKIDAIITRDIQCENDEQHYDAILSVSQALNFHCTEKKIVTRSGNGGVLELIFDDYKIKPLRCNRMHGRYDVVTVSYVGNSNKILSGSNHGEVVLSQKGEPLVSWQFGHETIHWFEHLQGDNYLIASDMRAVIKFNISNKYDPILFGNISRDDLEHVTYNKTSQRVFASSFDRNIYEIDKETCKPIAITFTTPFKNRWIKTLEKDPDKLFIQCRNGALYLVSVSSGKLLGELRETPCAMWTGDYEGQNIVLSGEGNTVLRFVHAGTDDFSRTPLFNQKAIKLDINPNYYTKRLVYNDMSESTILGRTDGSLIALNKNNEIRIICNVGSPIRDLAIILNSDNIFVATEDGTVKNVNTTSGTITEVYTSTRKEPIWAIAYNNEMKILAIAEREGHLLFVNGENYEIEFEDFYCRRPKRLKWLDKNRLYYSNGANLFCVDIETWEKKCVLENVGNTIEDFIWDPHKRYMILVNYQRNLFLLDINNEVLLHTASDDIDYSKGALWLNNPSDFKEDYNFHFITYGRGGKIIIYRIHDEKIISLGPGSKAIAPETIQVSENITLNAIY